MRAGLCIIVGAVVGFGAVPGVVEASPGGRGYELVSPGTDADVMVDTGRARSASGEAVGLPMAATFSSLTGFGDVRGAGVAADYLSQRNGLSGTSGWAVHAITPRQEPLSYFGSLNANDPVYELFSSDLTRGVFRAWSPLDDTANVAKVSNLYTREDPRVAGGGTYQLLSGSAAIQAPPPNGSFRPWLAGASNDFKHVVFESKLNLTPDATGGNVKLYKSDDGVVRLVAANAACAGGADPSAPCSIAGVGASPVTGGLAHLTPGVVSGDGARVTFTSPLGIGQGDMLPSTTPGLVSKLFQLDDRGTPAADDDAVVQVSMSEKASPDDAQAAIYQAASADGARVFFISSEQLTDAPGSGLYLWERQATDETQQVAVDATGGTFTLTAHTQPSQGLGTLTSGSTDVTDVVGSFTVGQAISGTGIDPGTTVTAVSGSGLSLSAPATADGQQSLTASIEATTDALASDATPAQVQDALASLGSIGKGNVVVSGGPTYTIEFTGALAGVNVMQLTSDAGGLTGGARAAVVTTTHDVRNIRLIGPNASSVLGASKDGRRIYFALNDDIWLWQDVGGVPALWHVAALATNDVQYQNQSTFWNETPTSSRVTPDGGTLLFQATDGTDLPPGYQHGNCAQAVTGANNGLCAELYVYRAAGSTPSSPDIVCASCNFDAPRATGNAIVNTRQGSGASQTTPHLARALTDDGQHVYFDTTESLAPVDTNGTLDVYEYDVATGVIDLISSGTDSSASYFMDASADGHDVMFATRAQLVGWDEDQAYDLYDARVGGGFPEPPPVAVRCSGDACQGQTPGAPGLAALGSSGFRGLGNASERLHRSAAPSRCRRGRVKQRAHGKTHCVKRSHRARKRARRATRSGQPTRRAGR